jgi:hypothetical protein
VFSVLYSATPRSVHASPRYSTTVDLHVAKPSTPTPRYNDESQLQNVDSMQGSLAGATDSYAVASVNVDEHGQPIYEQDNYASYNDQQPVDEYPQQDNMYDQVPQPIATTSPQFNHMQQQQNNDNTMSQQSFPIQYANGVDQFLANQKVLTHMIQTLAYFHFSLV